MTAPPLPLLTLKQRAAFLACASSGYKCATKGLVLQMRPRPDSAIAFGLTASKRVGNAVCRNRAKRRLRALAHEVLPDALPADYVLIAKTETLTRDYTLLRGDLLYALKKIRQRPARPAAAPTTSVATPEET